MTDKKSLQSVDTEPGQELVVCACVIGAGVGVSVSHTEMCPLCARFQSYHSPRPEVAVLLRK